MTSRPCRQQQAAAGRSRQRPAPAPSTCFILVSCCALMHVKGGTGGALRLVSFPFIFKHDQNLSWGNKYQVGTSRHPAAPACPLPRARRGRTSAGPEPRWQRRCRRTRGSGSEVGPADAAPRPFPLTSRPSAGPGAAVQLGPGCARSRWALLPASVSLPVAAARSRGSGVRAGPAQRALPAWAGPGPAARSPFSKECLLPTAP